MSCVPPHPSGVLHDPPRPAQVVVASPRIASGGTDPALGWSMTKTTYLTLLVVAVLAAGCQTTPTGVTSSTTVTRKTRDAAAAEASAAAAAVAAAHAAADKVPDRAVVYFDFDRSVLDDGSAASLREIAGYLQRHPRARVIITGHADERGTSEYNLALGQARAFAARDYIVRLGARPDQVQTTSLGEERPAVNGDGDAVWAKNRRDELLVVVEDA